MRSKIFLTVFLFFATLSFGGELQKLKEVHLKKDELIKMNVEYASYSKLFTLRWTLYKNHGLVIHRSYDRVVGQNVLYLNYTNQSIRLELKPQGTDFHSVPYLLIKFKKFDLKKHEAIFEFYLLDEKGEIHLQYLKNS